MINLIFLSQKRDKNSKPSNYATLIAQHHVSIKFQQSKSKAFLPLPFAFLSSLTRRGQGVRMTNYLRLVLLLLKSART